MPRKKKEKKNTSLPVQQSLDFDNMLDYIDDMEENGTEEEKDLAELLRIYFMPYAISVIEARAIPDLRDGLKPAHRKVLVTMNDMHLSPSHFRSKCANIAGQVLRLNPHSDSSAYATLVRLTDGHDALLMPLIDGKGNFGKHYSTNMAYSASRYTEARLMPIATEFFKSIKKDTVEFVDNYDSTMKEPTVLPVTFPNILANPNQGIAVGMASNICSFNFSELCLATAERIKHPRSDLLDIMPGPDFSTGAYLLNDREAIRQIYKTGLGSFTLRSKYHYDKKSRIIEITEIPYTTTIEQIISAVVDLVKKGKIKEINDIRDEDDLSGMTIAIDIKRGVDPDELMEKLFAFTPLQTTFAANFNVLINGKAEVLGVYGILDNWIEWRRECVRKEYEYDLKTVEHSLHLYEGLARIIADIDKVIRIIRNTEDDAKVIPALMKAFSLDEEQAEYIAEIKLRNLNKDYILTRVDKIPTLEEQAAQLRKITGSKDELNKIIIKQLKDLAKTYGQPRKTELADFEVTAPAQIKAAEENYPVCVSVTKNGYIKKMRKDQIKPDTDIYCREDDAIENIFEAENSGEMLIFTDCCTAYKLQISELPQAKAADIGEYIPNLIELDSSENVRYVCPLDTSKDMMFVFENGKIARIPMSAYETKQNRKKLLNAYGNISPLKWITCTDANDEYCMGSAKGRMIRFPAKLIPKKTTKNSQGVQVMNILKTDPEITRFGTVEEMKGEKVKSIEKIPATGRK